MCVWMQSIAQFEPHKQPGMNNSNKARDRIIMLLLTPCTQPRNIYELFDILYIEEVCTCVYVCIAGSHLTYSLERAVPANHAIESNYFELIPINFFSRVVVYVVHSKLFMKCQKILKRNNAYIYTHMQIQACMFTLMYICIYVFKHDVLPCHVFYIVPASQTSYTINMKKLRDGILRLKSFVRSLSIA